ncbi:MAG: CCA tRNA nucleotidyltransferase [Candidatus Micrarchaeota archaeon]
MQAKEDAELRKQAIEAVAEKVSRKISPSKQEADEEKRFAATVSKKISGALHGKAEIKFVGSAARDTGLAGDMDVDLFVAFPKAFDRQQIIEQTIRASKKAVKAKWLMRYAEHPYLQARVGKFKVEVIPCFQMKPHEKILSAVDRSPLHMDYLQRKLSEAQKRDVRVLKALLKNAGLYGAEVEVEGFSGLVCEQLVLNYRSLAGLVESAREWRPPVVIDLEGAYAGEGGRKLVEELFAGAPLVLVDAIDRNRNAAAAVSATNLSKFICLCRAFWQNPAGPEFFSRKTAAPDRKRLRDTLAEREHSLIALELPKPDLIEDILVPQLRKTTSAVARQLQLADFRVFDSTSFAGATKCFILLEVESDKLARVKKIQGPPVGDARACGRFLAEHSPAYWLRGPYVEGDRIFVEKQRAVTSAVALLNKIVALPKNYGVASHLAAPFRKARILEGHSVLSSEGLDENALRALDYFVFRRDWWLAAKR